MIYLRNIGQKRKVNVGSSGDIRAILNNVDVHIKHVKFRDLVLGYIMFRGDLFIRDLCTK